ncbi:response regulator [Pelagibius sp. Alg239-R121]|uniref:response regulator n=1 Tax=Pelagibius sp. Alg239-R121 TaxID=2993448 RepID=UPI0024A656DA|nr:response regulator [Pelagibius sp. Alg239-R121]
MTVLSRDGWGALSFLVADDAGVIRAMMEMTLLALGAGSVSMAADGEEALDVLKQNPVDIVISDLNMTPVSGLEFLRSLRSAEDPELAKTPVVVMSGYGEHEVKDEILAAGGDAFMTKPVKPGGIEEQVVTILESQGRLNSLVRMASSGKAA